MQINPTLKILYSHSSHFIIPSINLLLVVRILEQLTARRYRTPSRAPGSRRLLLRRSFNSSRHLLRRTLAFRRVLHVGRLLQALIGTVPRKRYRKVHVHAIRRLRLRGFFRCCVFDRVRF